MADKSSSIAATQPWPDRPSGKDVVLHTRVVTSTGGGPDKTILLSASYLEQTNYWLAAAYMHPPQDAGFDAIRKRAQAVNCPLIGIPDRGPLDRSVLRQLLDLCRHLDVRIWHAHDYKSNLLGLALRPFYAMKLVTTVHGWVKQTTRTPLYYAIDRWCLPYYHHVMSVSDDLHERVLKLGVPPQRATLIPNGIDERVFSRRYPSIQSPLRAQHQVPEGRLLIGAVGRLSPEKAFNNLIHAVHQLLGKGLDIELWIAGEGDAQSDLQKLIDHLGVGQRVKLWGFCDDTIGFYHALDMFVLSSLREGLPNVVLEAMAMGVPVVSTKVAGVPKLIQHGHNGMLCEVGDVDQLVTAMEPLLRQESERKRLAQEGRLTIERQCTFTQRMAKEKAVYDMVLGLPTPSGSSSESMTSITGRQIA